MRTDLGQMLADVLRAEAVEEMATHCEDAVDQLKEAQRNHEIGSRNWTACDDDIYVFKKAAQCLREIGGYKRTVTVS